MKIDREIYEYAIVYEVGEESITIARFDGCTIDEGIIETCFESICTQFSSKTLTFVTAIDLFRPWDDEFTPYKRHEVG